MTYTWEEAVELAIQKYPKARRIAVENATMGQEDSMIFRINLDRDRTCYNWNAQTMSAIRFIMSNTAARWGKEKKEDSMKMKKFKVIAQSLLEYVVEVEAENEDDAMDKADKIDGGEWTELHEGSWDWNPIRAEEVKE